MNFVAVLIAANILLPLWCISKSCISRHGLEVNHVLMFSLGFLFYWILPIAVGELRLFEMEPAMRLWYEIFNDIPTTTVIEFLLISLCGFLFFWGGSEWIRLRLRHTVPDYKILYFDKKLLNFPLVFGAVAAIFFTIRFHDQLFKGYTLEIGGANEDILKGTFIASSVFILSLAFVYTVKMDELGERAHEFGKLVFNRFFMIYFIVALLILSLGGRLYFISSLVMLLVYRTVYFRRIEIQSALWLLMVGLALSGLAGVLRQSSQLSLMNIGMSILVEPLFTSFSLIHFLRDNAFEIIKFPVFLLSNFIDLIPTPLFPQKLAFMLDPQDFGYIVYSPGGGENSFFSFMVNFGVFGTFAALFGVGASLSYLKVRDRNLLFRVMYLMLCGWLGFTFFRDPFFISIVKTMFQYSITAPLLTVIIVQIISIQRRNLRRQSPVPMKPSSAKGEA